MAGRNGVFLTGATGFLGRYLLRDLLHAGSRVAVLARDTRTADADERIRASLIDWDSPTGRPASSADCPPWRSA